jgi:hypothetical protein
VRITESAHKWGVTDEQMLHAIRYAVRTIQGSNDATLFIGSDQTGRLLEIGVMDLDTKDERIIHAMELRPGFYKYL